MQDMPQNPNQHQQPSDHEQTLRAWRVIESKARLSCPMVLDPSTAKRDLPKSTPERTAAMFDEMCIPWDETCYELNRIIADGIFRSDAPVEFVQVGPIRAVSMCPHHMLPVIIDVFVGYAPAENITLGLSKVARITQILAKRLITQEDFGRLLVDALGSIRDRVFDVPCLNSYGATVAMSATHMCMHARGVRSDARVTTLSSQGDATYLRNKGVHEDRLSRSLLSER